MTPSPDSLVQPSSTSHATRLCAECGTEVSLDDSILMNGLAVCANCKPTALAKLENGQAIGDAGIWRDRKTLVLGSRALLPDRCVKCNAPAETRLRRRLHWHASGWYALVLVNALIYLIAAMIVRKRATVEIGLCGKHRRARLRAMTIGWPLAIGGLAGIVVGFAQATTPASGWIFAAAFPALIVGMFWGIIGGRVVFPRRIDAAWIRLGGVGRAFLDALPVFPKPAN